MLDFLVHILLENNCDQYSYLNCVVVSIARFKNPRKSKNESMTGNLFHLEVLTVLLLISKQQSVIWSCMSVLKHKEFRNYFNRNKKRVVNLLLSSFFLSNQSTKRKNLHLSSLHSQKIPHRSNLKTNY